MRNAANASNIQIGGSYSAAEHVRSNIYRISDMNQSASNNQLLSVNNLRGVWIEYSREIASRPDFDNSYEVELMLLGVLKLKCFSVKVVETEKNPQKSSQLAAL